jgi:hypothetical protein
MNYLRGVVYFLSHSDYLPCGYCAATTTTTTTTTLKFYSSVKVLDNIWTVNYMQSLGWRTKDVNIIIIIIIIKFLIIYLQT